MMHPLYDESIETWRDCRDWAAGAVAVKKAGERYLPPLDVHLRSDQVGGQGKLYSAYLKRARVFEAYRRTLEFMTGIAFARPLVGAESSVLPTGNMDGSYNSTASVHRSVFLELLTTSRGAAFVDWDEARRQPFVRLFKPEQVTDWDYDAEGNLVYAEIEELRLDRSGEQPKMRLHRLVLEIRGGRYVSHVEYRDDEQNWVTLEGSGKAPERPAGTAMTEIPLVFYSVEGIGPRFETPVLYGIVELSKGHYVTDADLRHGAALTARPTVYTIGDTGEQELVIGSSVAWNLPHGTEVGMLQFRGESLQLLMEMQKADEQKMAALGARMLETEKRGVEASDTLRLRMGGGHASLSRVAETSVLVMRWVLNEMGLWLGAEVDADAYDMDRNFIPERMTPEELTALMSAVQSGMMSLDAYLYNVQRGGLLPDDSSAEEEKERIKLGSPGVMGSPG